MEKVKVGVIGCGMISKAYFEGAKTFKMLDITACSDLNMDAAKARAEEYGCKAVTVEELLADKKIKIILNLTIPAVHAEIAHRALDAGKHVYGEKPLALNRDDAKKIIEKAKKKKLLVGSAPDTVLGGGTQTCRKLIDDGWIGKPLSGTAFMMGHGPEGWHTNPGFYYLKGGGPMFDMGPYYITSLVTLLGPAKRVSASCSKGFKERIATSDLHFGKVLPVEVPTHYSGILEFKNGAVINMVMSFDVWGHGNDPFIEIYGTEGSLKVPNPNAFGGPVMLKKPGYADWVEVPLSHGYTDNLRSIGLADMVCAVMSGRKHRCNGDIAYHAVDIMQSFEESSDAGSFLNLKTTCERPEALPLGLRNGFLD
ncbi:MAG: oxidoreductase [Lentisphaerae bacterium GWF2_45_14]|nr:MAG: oxidoreductase [Lentisphaerae bacterium GWF2_45_14]